MCPTAGQARAVRETGGAEPSSVSSPDLHTRTGPEQRLRVPQVCGIFAMGVTGADRAWAARYQPGDVLHVCGSKK